MKPRLKIIFALLIAAPLVVLAWLGVKATRDEQKIVEHRFEELITGRLQDVNQLIVRLLSRHEKGLDELLDMGSYDAKSLRGLVRTQRMVNQIFVLDSDGELDHPPPEGSRNHLEEQFFLRTRRIWETKEVFYRPTESGSQSVKKQIRSRSSQSVQQTAARDRGWYVWYWGSGINLIYWRRHPDERVVGAEIDRVALLADIIGELPKTDPAEPGLPNSRIRLVDAGGNAVYSWGMHEPQKDEKPRVSRALSQPLGSWRLQYFPAPGYFDRALGGSLVWGSAVGFAALFVVVLGLSVYFVRESGKEVREATQKVTFVNQVSHELKTPLTNIRMYAELLDEHIDEDDQKLTRYAQVIVQESQRLSRLIANVLSFARKQRQKLVVRPASANVDRTIDDVIEQFRPGLESKDLVIEFEGNANETVQVDVDALGQILSNLLGNVEKYAASGQKVRITSRVKDHMTEIQVRDWGPGIPKGLAAKIFQPFYRASGKLTDGVAGTGIGLSIARDLARLHGGDLTLEPSDTGACFEITLETPVEKGAPQ